MADKHAPRTKTTFPNLDISDLPPPPPGIKVISYADDITIYASASSPSSLYPSLNSYLDSLYLFLSSKQLIISSSKSTVTLFTPDTHEAIVHPQIFINNSLLPLARHPKILGVTFDTMFTFNEHAKIVAKKMQQRNNTLKALCGTTWGQSKETLTTTYNSYIRSLSTYAAPVWTPNLKPTNFNRLQIAQNSALRTITGCHRITPILHLHQECQSLTIKDHNHLLTDQYLLSCHDPLHVSHSLSRPPNPPRQMKHSLFSFSSNRVNQFSLSLPPNSSLSNSLGSYHTHFVSLAVSSLPSSPVLGAPPPPIHPSEQLLPRHSRVRLAQLRSGHCSLLQSFQHTIDNSIPDICPHCNSHDHSVPHLFTCQTLNLQLPLESLWTDPVSAVSALRSAGYEL